MTNLSPYIRPVKAKVKKPKSKGTKAASVEKVTVDQLISQLGDTSFILEQQPYHSLLQIYKKQFLDVSVSKGLINANSLSVAGDGTPVVTSHRMRSNHICDCAEKGISECNCDRYFSQPDCDIGWDSSRDCWYHGYDLYMLVASDSDAHDAMPIYEYCKRENIVPFIDLNKKRGIKVKYKNDFTIGKDGVPFCKE